MAVSVGPKGTVEIPGAVLVPEKRPGERTVAVYVADVHGAIGDACRAYFRALLQPAGDREVTVKFGTAKAVNLRPAASYLWRVEVPTNLRNFQEVHGSGPADGVIVRAGEIIPGSAPQEVSSEDLRVFSGRFPMVVQDYTILIEEEPPEEEPSLPPGDYGSS